MSDVVILTGAGFTKNFGGFRALGYDLSYRIGKHNDPLEQETLDFVAFKKISDST